MLLFSSLDTKPHSCCSELTRCPETHSTADARGHPGLGQMTPSFFKEIKLMPSPWLLKTMGHARGEDKATKHSRPVMCRSIYKYINKNTCKGFPLPARYSLRILSRAEGQRWQSFCSPISYPLWLSTFAFQDVVRKDRQKSNLLSGGDRKADRAIKGRRGKTNELNETVLLPGLPEGGQRGGRTESATPKVRGNDWEWMTTPQNWSNHSRQSCHTLSVQRLLILEDLLPVMFLKAFQNCTDLGACVHGGLSKHL